MSDDDIATANDLRVQLIALIERTQRRMVTATFARSLRAGTAADRAAAAKAMLDLTLARERLKASVLDDIGEALNAHARDLRDGIAALGGALDDLKRIKPILDGIADLLGVVTRIVALV
jgi:hypothetical protein